MLHFNFMVNWNMSTFPKMKCLIFLNDALQVRKRFENNILSLLVRIYRKCYITEFSSFILFYILQLLKLKMDGNKIANITNATFVGLKSLKSISLQDNLLSSLQENLFVFLSKVSQLKSDSY